MQAYHASWQDSHSSDFTSVTLQCTLVPAQGLCFLQDEVENCWAFEELQLEADEAGGFALYREQNPHQRLRSQDYRLLNHLLPFLSGVPRQRALVLYAEHRPQRSKWLLGGVVLGMLIFAGVLWLFFWGQIQLRKQQLAITNPETLTQLGARQQAELEQTVTVCSDPPLHSFSEALSQQYSDYVPDTLIKGISFFVSEQAESFMLSHGQLYLSTALVQNMTDSTLLALISHQEGHLRLNHRLESRIYEQGNRIFYRLWQPHEDLDFLLAAPLRVNYSRGQEAAADHWAFTHLNEAGLAAVDFQGFAKYILVNLESTTQAGGFVERHPMATDRLQGLAQREPLKKLSKTSLKNFANDSRRKALKNCEYESMSK